MLLRVIDLQRPVRWGMAGYVRASFRVRSFGLEQLQLSRLVQPVAISYDPLAPGRVRAYLSVAAPIVTSRAPGPPAGTAAPAPLDDRVTDAMRRAIPLARARRRGAGDQLIRALAQELRSANEAS